MQNHKKELNELIEEHRNELTDRTRKHQEDIDQLKTTHEAEIEEMKLKWHTELTEVMEKGQLEVTDIKNMFEDQLRDLKKIQESEMEELKRRHELEMEEKSGGGVEMSDTEDIHAVCRKNKDELTARHKDSVEVLKNNYEKKILELTARLSELPEEGKDEMPLSLLLEDYLPVQRHQEIVDQLRTALHTVS